jgi:peptidoglycan/LPS O-acetylase OafA/YrhL
MNAASPPAENHLDPLDALRGIAIFGVCLVHATVLVNPSGALLVFGGSGQRGVQLFYIISAFTLCLSLDLPRSEKQRLRNFYLRRFFRIAPLFYVVFVLNVAASFVGPAFSTFRLLDRYDIALGLLLMHGLSPRAINYFVNGGWSVAVEVMFYALLPFLFRYFHTTVRLIFLLAISAPTLYVICHFLGNQSTSGLDREYFTFFWFPVELPVFIMGMLSYSVWKQYVKGRSVGAQAARRISLMLLGVSCILFAAALPNSNSTLYLSSFAFIPLQLALLIRP